MTAEPKRPKAGDKLLIFVLVPLLVLLLASAGPLRDWAHGSEVGYEVLFGAAPNFFAGAIIALFVAIMEKTTALRCFLVAVIATFVLELTQMFVPSQTFDLWDVAAGIAGAGLVYPLIKRQGVK